MSRDELVRYMVLDWMADDYENVDQIIFPTVAKVCAEEYGLTIERPEVVSALAGLIADGLAKAYLLSGREPFATELQGMPSLDVVEEDFKTYFYPTKKGIDIIQALDDWPWPYDGRTT